MTNLSWALAVATALPLALTGCLDVIGCWGEADWTEPGLSAWLEEHGHDAGLGPGVPGTGLQVGPRLAAALPPESVLSSAEFHAEGFIDPSKPQPKVYRDVGIEPGRLDVDSWSMGGGGTPPSDEAMLQALDQVLDLVYRGNASARVALRDEVAGRWPQVSGDIYRVEVATDGPWDLDVLLPQDGKFVTDDFGEHSLDTGNWRLSAVSTSWWYHWGGLHELAVDGHDKVRLRVTQMDYGHQAKDLVNRTFPGFAWAFPGFTYHTNCVPGPIF